MSRIPVTLVTEIGVRLPAHLTASGRSILAHLPAAQVRALFPSAARLRRPNRPGAGARCPNCGGCWQAERQQKWAEEIGLITAGLQSVAACAFDHSGWPVRGHQRDVAPGPRPRRPSRTGARGACRRAAADLGAVWPCPGRLVRALSEIRDSIAVSAGHSGAGWF